MQARGRNAKTAYRVKTISQSRYKSCPRDIWEYWPKERNRFHDGMLSQRALQTVVNHGNMEKHKDAALDNRIGSVEAILPRTRWRRRSREEN